MASSSKRGGVPAEKPRVAKRAKARVDQGARVDPRVPVTVLAGFLGAGSCPFHFTCRDCRLVSLSPGKTWFVSISFFAS